MPDPASAANKPAATKASAGSPRRLTLKDKPAAAGPDDNPTQSHAQPDPVPAVKGRAQKEIEPAVPKQEEVLAQIKEASREADLAAEKELEAALGKEAKLAHPEAKVDEMLKDHEVKSPQEEASAVIEKGTVIKLPLTEGEFSQAEKGKITPKVDRQKNVLGVSSVIALAMWIGRLIKIAHENTLKKVVFKKDN